MIQLDDEILAVLNGNANMEHFFLYLLLESNDGVLQKSYAEIENDTGLSVQTIRNCLAKFKQAEICLTDTNKVTRRGTTRNVLQITVCDIERYITSKKTKKQARNKDDDKGEQQKTPVPSAKKTLDERKAEFAESLKPYLEKYGRDMLNKFYSYWTQINNGGKKMLFEKERDKGAFEIGQRLATWAGNERVFNHGKQTYNGSGTTTEQRLNDAASLISKLTAEGTESDD